MNFLIGLTSKPMHKLDERNREETTEKTLGKQFKADVEAIFQKVESRERVKEMGQFDPKHPDGKKAGEGERKAKLTSKASIERPASAMKVDIAKGEQEAIASRQKVEESEQLQSKLEIPKFDELRKLH